MPHYLVHLRVQRRIGMVVRAANADEVRRIINNDTQNQHLPDGEIVETNMVIALTDEPYRVASTYAAELAENIRHQAAAQIATEPQTTF